MSFTYSGNPGYSSRDAVRFLLQDTSTSAADFHDAEIEWLVAQQPNIYKAAAMGARAKAAEVTDGVASKTVGSLTLTYSERSANYLKLAASLEAQAKVGLGGVIVPYSGGISKIDKELEAAESDFDTPYFYRGMHDAPGSDDVKYSYPRGSTA